MRPPLKRRSAPPARLWPPYRRRERRMTVCIAAVCNVGPEPLATTIVAAADRMITIGDLEYEPEQTKIVELAGQTIALLAGDMQLHAAVVPKVRKLVRDALHDNPTNIDVAEIAEMYARE